MKKLLFTSLIALSSLTHAEIIRDRIHAVEDGMIKFENGRVAFIKSSQEGLVANALIEAEVTYDSKLVSFKKLLSPLADPALMTAIEEEPITPESAPPVFEPTIVPNMAEMQNIFNRSNSYYKRVSECTDRAHVWAHDEFKFSGTKSEKVFVFFTASYINSVGFKWWFHVAPLYSVNTGNGIQKMVADFRYTSRPMTVKEWTDQMVYTKRPCKVTTKFSEYDVNPQTENCYLMYGSMHYKLPADFSAEETTGRYKSSTPASEVEFSRRLGFQQL